MVYGMTARHPWAGIADPRPVWKIWDDFGIGSAEMKGYWREDCPVRTTHPDIYATAYVKEKAMLISLASWADKPVSVRLLVDWQSAGPDPQEVKLIAPEIRDFQESRTFGPSDPITREPGKGWLFLLK
jgi:hypothetical protein